MAGFKEQVFGILGGFSEHIPLSLLRDLSGQRLVMPVYHLVSDEPVNHVRHLYPIKGTAEFEADLDFLLKHYSPIGLPQLIAWVREGESLPKNAFFLSFDDGLREFHDIIAPILLRKGVPAACFLNSDFIDNRGLFFRYKVSLALNALDKNPELSKKDAVKAWLHNQGKTDIRNALLAIGYDAQREIDELLRILEIDVTDYLREKQPYLTSHQIKKLIGQGFHFGAHSCDHPEYRFIPLEEQLNQTFRSTDGIATQFQLPYRAFAFPFTDFGVGNAFFERVYQNASPIDISFGCAGMKSERYPQHFQRIPMEKAGRSAKQTLHSEYLYHLLKAPLGRNSIERA